LLRRRSFRCAGCTGAISDVSEHGADIDFFIFTDENLVKDTGSGCGNFSIDLVGGYFEDWFVNFDGVANVLEPGGDGAGGHRLTEGWHCDGFRHF
jgi:hypothetical protein